MEHIEEFNEFVNKNFICSVTENVDKNFWWIQSSPLGGRGLFAIKDYNPGDIIFIDKPLLIGPRSYRLPIFHCVICGKINNIKVCSKGCGLPLCSIYCALSIQHLKECQLIKKFIKIEKFSEINQNIFRGLISLRFFLLENKYQNYFLSLMHHTGSQYGYEVELLKKYLKFSKDQEEILKRVCSILDANCFETIKQSNHFQSIQISLRALYPIASLLNHRCIPNTSHHFDNSQNIVFKASQPISTGSEIFTTYTSLLWGTTSRRHHLQATKHFWCECLRCQDPTEFKTGLSGLKCISKDCQGGVLYPINALEVRSDWICKKCRLKINCRKIGIIQNSLGGLLKTMDVTDLQKLINFYKDRLINVVPLSNQIAVEIKLKIVWMLGYTEKYFWNDLTDDNLNLKEELCRELLKLCNKLKMDFTSVRGQILFELYKTLMEKYKRTNYSINNEDLKGEIKKTLQEAIKILHNDITAPKEIKKIVCSNCNQ